MKINTVTVLGANGTMGRNVSGIFASFGNAKVYMVVRSLQDAKNAKKQATLSVKAEAIGNNLIPKTYDDLDECIAESDLVFESVAEDLDTKRRIYHLIGKYLKEGAIVGTGTSGLSINELSESFNKQQRRYYLGIHMYNPPYNMSLCEIIPSAYTDKSVVNSTKKYLKEILLRDVVEIKDGPAFMGNRIGFQFINEALQYAEKYKNLGGIDYIDAILGSFTGRSMPPLVTSDFVGLDVHKAIVDNIFINTNDYEHKTFRLPEFAQSLIQQNKLGRKTGEGLYRRVVDKEGKKTTEVYDIASQKYRPVKSYTFEFVQNIKNHLANGRYLEATNSLINDQSDEALMCTQLLIKYILYSLYITKEIGEDIHSSDHVMATGFNWIPPLALIDAFNEVNSFEEIVNQKMPQDFLGQIDLSTFLKNIEKSTYDYRPFLKAK